jgi:hypothetical protein
VNSTGGRKLTKSVTEVIISSLKRIKKILNHKREKNLC